MNERRAMSVCLMAGLAAAVPAMAQSNQWRSVVRLDQLPNTLTGAGVRIGQIEGGDMTIDNHEDFTTEFRRGGGPAATAVGVKHATHVAGIMIAKERNFGGGIKSQGVAPSAKLQTAWGSSSQEFYEAMDWFFINPAPRAINVSWGYDPPLNAEGAKVNRIADWAVDTKGSLIVVAAPNSGPGATGMGAPDGGYNVLTVGATGEKRELQNYRRLGNYSGRGGTADGRNKPDIVAPGSRIYSPREELNGVTGKRDLWGDDDFPVGVGQPANLKYVSGCSFATPITTGTVSLLNQHSVNKGYTTDPRVMKAVIMNSADKSVTSNNFGGGTWKRWEEDPNLSPTNPLSNDLGAGMLDAYQAYKQYDAGKASPTLGNGGTNAEVPTVGWDLGTADAVGLQNSYRINTNLRKGSYLTSTLAWNRHVERDRPAGPGGTPAAVTNAFDYGPELQNLDMRVAKLGAIGTPLKESKSTVNSTEHIVFKVPEKDQYYVQVMNKAGTNANEKYGLAWHSYASPTTTREFNGDFSGDRGALCDNGWFDASLAGSSSVTRPYFTNQDSDASWAMTLVGATPYGGGGGMAQELVTPSGGFYLRFDAAFDGSATTPIYALLGGIDLTAAAGYASGILPTIGTNMGMFKTYELFFDAAAIAGLTGSFNDLVFRGGEFGSNAYIDNVVYLPEPGTVALVVFGGLLSARRRRT
ncbi:MAG: S8 family serine peptidase [Phycisphaerae bacterium]|nr:S8 family serine peptidase [Phycisphaerae bacterium]